MARYSLLPPNFQDLDFWKEFCNAVDAVWKNRIDNPQKAFQLLRDTYPLTYSGYGEPVKNSYPNGEKDSQFTKVFDVKDFFDFSREPEYIEITLPSATDTIDLATFYAMAVPSPYVNDRSVNQVQNGYPKALILIYRKVGDTYSAISPMQFHTESPSIIKFTFPFAVGTTLKIVERISAPELSSQLRFLGFQFPDTEFINRSSSYVAAPSLSILASNFSNYLSQTKGTRQFMDFYGFCMASEFEVVQLWAEKTKADSSVNYWDRNPPYLYYKNKEFNTTLMTDTATILLNENYDITGLPVPTSTIDVYYQQPGQSARYLSPYYYYISDTTSDVITINGNFYNPLTQDNTLVEGTKINVKYKRPAIPYGTLYNPSEPIDGVSVGTPVWNSGNWFPTSHVDLRYSLEKYGGSIDFNEIRNFFKYVANLNLVLRDVVLYQVVPLPGLSVGGAMRVKITQL